MNNYHIVEDPTEFFNSQLAQLQTLLEEDML